LNKLIIGCGYLGRRVAARWLAQGHFVDGMTRTHHDELEVPGVRQLVGDVRELLDVGLALPAESILYSVAPGRTSGQTPDDVWGTGLINCTSVAQTWPTRPRFIFISSASVYGQTDGEWVTEAAPTVPMEESGRVLLEAEQRLLGKCWPDAVILRFAGIYGPGRLLRSKSILAGEPIVADPDKWLNLIHVEDGADAILAAEARGNPGSIYNICDGHPVRRREFYSQMAHVLGAPPPRFVPPSRDEPLPPHESANRRISNERMREEFRVELEYPTYESGLLASK
jgi:nucleoside-diphosphate-sugar epimerase